MREFNIGQRWLCDADLALGLGTITSVDQRTVTVMFNAAGETRVYAKQSAPLTRVEFAIGDCVSSREGWQLTIEGVQLEQGILVYTGSDDQGRQAALAETALADMISLNRPADRLLNGRIDQEKWFRLRYQALFEYNRQLSSDLYGLIGTRTSLIPHQLYIAHEVAHRYAPRVLLADEVGLGKTIEAGLILHQQLLTERVQRVLIVVPENLMHQWLVEMLRRFNLYFSIFDEQRCQAIAEGNEPDNPFLSEQLILCSLQFLNSHAPRVKQAVGGDWDLLVVDEAHHLHWTQLESSSEYRIIEQLAANTRGVLLLTATPEQSGKAGHFARLRLLDPDRFSNYEDFVREEEEYGSIARVINALLDEQDLTDDLIQDLDAVIADAEGKKMLEHIQTLDTTSAEGKQFRQRLIEILVDRHGTGRVLFRNTRAAVKGFPVRAVSAYALPLPEPYAVCLALTKDDTGLDQQTLLSPEILYMAGRAAGAPHWTVLDPRIEWLVNLMKKLKLQKVLLITAMMQTALDIVDILKVRCGIHAAVFHERMSLLERDRAAAYFADREQGCQLLICSEIGSEGRNFQFAHHLVLFDLPFDPDLLEQRIGRLDRIGQTETINIHVPYLENSAQSVMYYWYQEGLNAFAHTCPAGYPVFCQLREQLLQALMLANVEHHDMPDFIQRTRDLHQQINLALQAGRDRLLEYNSCQPELAAELKRLAQQQDQDSNIEIFMDSVFDCFGVHIEEHGRLSHIISPSEKMMAPYPGLADEGMTITYSRDTALAYEDMHFLSWEHPMVITGIDMVLSNEYGNAVVCSFEHGEVKAGTVLLEGLYVLEPARVAGSQVNRYFPPTLIRILIDEHGADRTVSIDHAKINQAAEYIAADIAIQVIRLKENELRTLLTMAGQQAEQQVEGIMAAAKQRVDRIFDTEIGRLQALTGINKNIRSDEIEYFKRQRKLLTDTIDSAKLRLDALRVIVAT